MKEWFKNYKNNGLLEIAIITIIVLISAFVLSNHTTQIMSDRGREFILPEAILSGAVPYKDILMIYFPLAYYINALFFAIGGISMNTIYFAETLNCLFYAIIFFLLAKEFTDKKTALLLDVLITESCLFSGTIFGFVLPYSYSMTYGLSALLATIFCLVKFLKTNDIKFAYLGSVFTGIAISFKLEFLPLVFILIIALGFYKRLKVSEYIKAIALLGITPLVLLLVLLIQGVQISDIMHSVEFAQKFATTDSMRNFLQFIGAIPNFGSPAIIRYMNSILGFGIFFFLTLSTFFLHLKLKKKYDLIFFGIIVFILMLIFTEPFFYTMFFPAITLLVLLIFIKKVIKKPEMLILVLGALIPTVRVFFAMRMHLYGTYSFPLLILTLYVMFQEILPTIKNTETKQYLNYCTAIYLSFFIFMNIHIFTQSNYEVKSERGNLNIYSIEGEPLQEAITTIKQYTKETDKVLVLPEGSMLNFWSNRKSDYNLHMLDRLYYDALGPEKSIEMIKNADYKMIIMVNGFLLAEFGYPYLYNDDNPVTKYIKSNYKVLKIIKNGKNNNSLFILIK